MAKEVKTDIVGFEEQSSTPTSPGSGERKFYIKDDGFAYILDSNGTEVRVGTGAGGGKNYIDNGEAETDTAGWATYADAAADTPVDGTGGSPTVTFTRTTTASEVLRGTGSFKLAKDAADRQGEGASYDFPDSIENADQASVIRISFDYSTSANYADGDMRVYVYDITNSQVIEPVATEILAGTGEYVGYFQSSSDGTSYRLIFHVASTNATAYDVFVDTVKVSAPAGAGNVSESIGARGEDATGTLNASFNDISWTQDYDTNNAFDGTTFTAPESGYYDVSGQVFVTAATVAAGNVQDVRCLVNGGEVANHQHVYQGTSTANTSVEFTWLGLYLNKGDAVKIQGANNATTPSYVSSTTQAFVVFRKSAGLPESSEARVVAARYTHTAGQSVASGTPDVIDYETADFDTHAAVTTGGSWVYTAPVSGKYRVSAAFRFASASFSINNEQQIRIYKNGALQSAEVYRFEATASDNPTSMSINDIVDLSKGDTIDVRVLQSEGANRSLSTASSDNYIAVERISGPSQIAANEVIAARLNGTNQSVATATDTDMDFASSSFDTHGAGSTGSDNYTLPASGKYLVKAQISWSANATGTREIKIVQDGTDRYIFNEDARASGEHDMIISGLIDGNKGDVITIELRQTSGGNLSLVSDSSQNNFNIHRLGF